MKVKFNSPEEFCHEMEKDKAKIDREIVRTTSKYVVSKMSPHIHHVFALATYSVNGQIVEMEKYCGDTWGVNKDSDREVLDKSTETLAAIEETAGHCGCEVRSGILEE